MLQVDLAGSERVSKSHAQGERLKEAAHINKSLAALGDVFMSILSRNSHVPFRNSKLTYLLQESIGGNSKTLMFVNVSPEQDDQAETVCSLLFASRVAKVELGAASKRADNGEVSRLTKELQDRESHNRVLETKLQDLQRTLASRETETLELAAAKDEEIDRRQSVEKQLADLEHNLREEVRRTNFSSRRMNFSNAHTCL